MRFSTRTRYGLRFLLRLSSQDSGARLQLGQIAKEEGISPGYLEQIVRALKKAGILCATRGSRGGYCLAREPEEITLDEVFSCLEGDTYHTVGCLAPDMDCAREPHCKARMFWKEMDDRMRAFLRKRTLAHVRDMPPLQAEFPAGG